MAAKVEKGKKGTSGRNQNSIGWQNWEKKTLGETRLGGALLWPM